MVRTLGLAAGLVAGSAVLAVAGAPPAAPVAAPAAARTQTAYVFTDLGVLGGLDSRGRAISDSGYVVGLGDTSPGSWIFGYHAFRWTPRHRHGTVGSIADLGALAPGERSAANGVAASGTVVGESFDDEGWSRGFWYDGRLRALPGLGGGPVSAEDVNDHHRAVGVARRLDGHDHAVLWALPRRPGTRVVVVDLGRPAGRVGSAASAVNERGQVAGSAEDADFYGVATLWTPRRPHGTRGTWRELGTLAGASGSVAEDLDDHGVVVGHADPPEGDRGWRWDGRMHVLPPLPGGTASYAYAINDHGLVVGSSNVADGSSRAVAFRSDRVRDLNDLMPRWAVEAGFVLREALDVNDRGQVVGVASIGDHAHAFLLTPSHRR